MLSQLSVYSLEKLAILFFLLSRSLTITFIYLFLFIFFFVFIFTFIESLLLGRKNRLLLCVSLFCSTFLYILFFFYIQLFSFYPSSLIHFSTCMYTSFILRVRVFCVLCTCIMPRILHVIVYVYICVCEYIDICSRARMPTVYTDFKLVFIYAFF